MIQCLDWIEKLGKVILREVNVAVEDYIDTITSPGVPLDFIAIVVLCRIYHIHICIYESAGMWCTCRSKPFKDCRFWVVFNGAFTSMETVKAGMALDYQRWLNKWASEGRLPSYQRSSLVDDIKTEVKLGTVQDALAIVNNKVFCRHGQIVQNDCNECPTGTAQERESFKTEAKSEDAMESDSDTDISCIFYFKEDSTEQTQDNKAKLHQMLHNNVSTDAYLEQSSKDNLLCSEVLPPAFEADSDKKIDTLWQTAQATISNTWEAFGFQNSFLNSTSTTLGNKEQAYHENEHEPLMQCPVCSKMETTQKACLADIKEQHPEFKFMCSSCSKQFSTYSAKYQHEQDHKLPSHFCLDCRKGFWYNSELERHAGVHKEILPYPCTQCNKRFAQKKSLACHGMVHKEYSKTCPKCKHVFDTPDRFYNHYRGAHGKGYKTRGKIYQWPGGCARHHESCTKCCAIIKAEKDSAEQRKYKLALNEQPQDLSVKKRKSEEDNSKMDIQETKEKIKFKLENIRNLKEEMWNVYHFVVDCFFLEQCLSLECTWSPPQLNSLEPPIADSWICLWTVLW